MIECVQGNSGLLPQLVPDQILKLKQLSVLTLAETNKVYKLIVLDTLILMSCHFFLWQSVCICLEPLS